MQTIHLIHAAKSCGVVSSGSRHHARMAGESFHFFSGISKCFWQEPQENKTGIPKSQQFLTFLTETLVESFLPFVDARPPKDASAGWSRLHRQPESVMVVFEVGKASANDKLTKMAGGAPNNSFR
jgi:hypothetical protein